MSSSEWGKRVSVTLLHESETVDFEARYVASTIGGTPRNATISVESEESKGHALHELREALKCMGFEGRIFVSDVTEAGQMREYEA